MKAVYYFVTFVAALFVIAFVSWNVYVQWPAIEATVRQALPPQQQVAPPAKKKCECDPNCPRGGCEDCKCEKAGKQCCPGH